MEDIDFGSIFSDVKWTNARLNTFVTDNRLPSKNREAGHYYAGLVFECLKNRGQFSVARVRLVGSVGKGTASWNSDFDLVAFVNDEHPPFKRVLQSFHTILATSNIPKLKNLQCSRYTVQFDINGYCYDLLAATNFETEDTTQFDGAFDFIEDLNQPWKHTYKYSTAFGEDAVEFVKNKSQFVKDVIILAKAWSNSVQGLDYISGKSFLIELVAIYANSGKPRSRNKNIITGFVRFLKMMADFPNIYVGFTCHYKWDCVPQSTQDEKPLVLDPINPWNNLASGVCEVDGQILSGAALEMLDRLQNFGFDDFTDIKELFAPIDVDY